MRTLGCFLSPKYTQDWLRVKNKPDYWISKLRPGALTKKVTRKLINNLDPPPDLIYNEKNMQNVQKHKNTLSHFIPPPLPIASFKKNICCITKIRRRMF